MDATHDLVVRPLEPVAEDEHRHRRAEGQQRERHVQHEQHAEDGGDLHEDQDEEHRAEPREAAHDREVGHRAREQLA